MARCFFGGCASIINRRYVPELVLNLCRINGKYALTCRASYTRSRPGTLRQGSYSHMYRYSNLLFSLVLYARYDSTMLLRASDACRPNGSWQQSDPAFHVSKEIIFFTVSAVRPHVARWSASLSRGSCDLKSSDDSTFLSGRCSNSCLARLLFKIPCK